jgi:hypothetical protein
MGAPTDRDVKRLFAASGNRCAFPKCDLAIAGEDNSLIGEICHICGNRPNSARYDTNQSDLERHAFENLILLCANHHKVIDDDEESYPVARLRKMKAVHEAKHLVPPHGDHVDRIVKVLIDQSVSSIGQSGGLTAGNVNAGVIHIHPGAPVDPERSQAIKLLWNALVGFKSAFSDVLFIDNILLASEIDDFFRGKSKNAFFDVMTVYRDPNHVPTIMRVHMPDQAERSRLLVSARLWSLYGAGLSFYGRTAMLLTLSFKERRLNNWRNDDLLTARLLSVFPVPFVDGCKKMTIGGLSHIAANIDEAFLKESRASS